MPYEIQRRGGVLHVKLTGCIDPAELARLGESVLAAERDASFSANRFADLSGIESIALDHVQIESFAERRRIVRLKNKIRSAIYAPDPVHYGFARMYQTLNDHPDMEIGIFEDIDAALRWVNDAPTITNQTTPPFP